jgi:hypothetical protein
MSFRTAREPTAHLDVKMAMGGLWVEAQQFVAVPVGILFGQFFDGEGCRHRPNRGP